MASFSAVFSNSMEEQHQPLQQQTAPFSQAGSNEDPLILTVHHVYALGKDIAHDMQQISAGEVTRSGQVVEKMVKALEWLETYVEEVEDLRTSNYRLLLKADELVKEKERRSALEHELKGMQLVVEERGRQRDTLAQRVSDLESQNNHYQEQINEIEQNKSLMLRREKYSSPAVIMCGTVSGSIISEEETTGNNTVQDYLTRTRSLDRRSLKGRKKDKEKEPNISQLQKELANEKKKVTELRESRALEQRRIQQRLKHMEQEITSLTKQLSTSQLQIEKLTREKIALLERSEVLTEVKAITLATIARGNLQQHKDGDHSFETESTESSPRFYKKDLLMILQDRNELKEKVSALQDKLNWTKKKLSQYESITPNQSRGHSPSSTVKRSNGSTPTFDRTSHITQRIEDSLVIVDLNSSNNSSYNGHRLYPPSPYLPSSLAPSPGPIEYNGGSNSWSQKSMSSLEDKSSELTKTCKKSFEFSTSL